MSSQPQVKKIIHLPKMTISRQVKPSRGGHSFGIKITNVKTLKPVQVTSAATIKQQEEDKLRAQLHKEIEWRSRICAHRGYECTLPVLVGRDYCARHVLQDAAAPYRQCAHTGAAGRRCPLPAPAPPTSQPDHNRRDQGLCFEHARAALAARQRSAAPPPPVTTTETLLNRLQHYVRPERTRTTSCASAVSVVSDPAEQEQAGLPHAVDPFKQIDARIVNSSVWTGLMECASASDSDADSVTLGRGGSCRAGHHEDSSGDEDAPYDRHPLRYAGIFTAEEAVSEAKTALRMLQAAYLRQMGRLRGLLQVSRAQYLKALRAEKEQYCSINTQTKNGPLSVHERRQLRKLKAYAGFHRRHGVEAVLARKLHHKRAKVNDMSGAPRPGPLARCTFAEGGVRCAGAATPAARHCLRHILHDHHQVLFYACGDSRAGQRCAEPLARLPLPSAACRYHTDPPPYTTFALKKDESDSESETNTATEGEESHNEAEYAERPSTATEGTNSNSDAANLIVDCLVPRECMPYN